MSNPGPPNRPAARRWLLAAAALLPVLAILALAWWQGRDRPLLGDFAPAQVARIHIQRQSDGRRLKPLVLERHPQGWQIASVADAPADGPRIEHLLRQLATLSGQPASTTAATAQPAQPVQPARLDVRLFDRQGHEIAAVAFSATAATRLPDGPAIAIATPPALPDWASGWTTLHPPAIAIDQIVAVEPIADTGNPAGQPLPPAAVGQTVALLLSLGVQDFAAAGDIDWSASRRLRVRLRDGAAFDLEQAPDGEGRYFLRLTSDHLESIRAASGYAFRVEQPLPQPAG